MTHDPLKLIAASQRRGGGPLGDIVIAYVDEDKHDPSGRFGPTIGFDALLPQFWRPSSAKWRGSHSHGAYQPKSYHRRRADFKDPLCALHR